MKNRSFSAMAGAGLLCFSLNANSVEVEHQVLEVDSVLGIPAVQAVIFACLGEEVFFTGTVRITLTDGVPTHFNWGPMTGKTLDGDIFAGGSGVTVGTQSNITLAEIGAGRDARQFQLHIVQGTPSVICHQ